MFDEEGVGYLKLFCHVPEVGLQASHKKPGVPSWTPPRAIVKNVNPQSTISKAPPTCLDSWISLKFSVPHRVV